MGQPSGGLHGPRKVSTWQIVRGQPRGKGFGHFRNHDVRGQLVHQGLLHGCLPQAEHIVALQRKPRGLVGVEGIAVAKDQHAAGIARPRVAQVVEASLVASRLVLAAEKTFHIAWPRLLQKPRSSTGWVSGNATGQGSA